MRSHSRGITLAKANAYRDTFVKHVHMLLWMGYSRLERSTLPDLEEPDISWLICKKIEDVCTDINSPSWTDFYTPHDDPPVHDPKRRGKRRRRVDIKITSGRTRPRSQFCFEAKRLKNNGSESKYLGKDGLGLFLDGDYSSGQEIAGMIAYIQTDDCEKWCSKIAAKLDKDAHQLGRGGAWTSVTITSDLSHTYHTIHKRAKRLKNITIVHTLLDCTGKLPETKN